MNQKYVIVKGIAGLGNRLITLTTAITYAKRTGRQIIIDWTEGQYSKKGENAFFQCFDLKHLDYKESITDIENIQNLTVYPRAWTHYLNTHGYTFVYKKVNIPYLSGKIKSLGWKGEITKVYGFWRLRKSEVSNKGFKKDESILTLKDKVQGILTSKGFPRGANFTQKRKEDIVVYMDYQPNNLVIDDFLQHIALKPYVSSMINDYENQLGLSRNTIGIHVRFTDKMPTKDIMTIVDKVKKLKLNNPLIYLATDNAEVLSFFRNHFSNIFSFGENIPKPPNSDKGIHHHFNDETAFEIYKMSIIDMWLLSRCEYLFYQGNSSFSLISSYLHKNKSKVFNWMSDTFK